MKQIIVDNIVTNYYIDEEGRCYNSKTGKYLKGQISNSGYLNYNLSLTPIYKKRLYAHRLVAQHFIENPENKPEVNHIDGNKLNNKLENLEWVTPSENQLHTVKRHERSNANLVYRFNKDKELIHIYDSVGDVERHGFTYSVIRQECSNPVKALAYNSYWSYENDNTFKTISYPNTGKAKMVGQYDKETGELLNIYDSTGIAAKAVGVKTGSHIGECCRNKIKSYKGYVWKYIDE